MTSKVTHLVSGRISVFCNSVIFHVSYYFICVCVSLSDGKYVFIECRPLCTFVPWVPGILPRDQKDLCKGLDDNNKKKLRLFLGSS